MECARMYTKSIYDDISMRWDWSRYAKRLIKLDRTRRRKNVREYMGRFVSRIGILRRRIPSTYYPFVEKLTVVLIKSADEYDVLKISITEAIVLFRRRWPE